MSVNSADQESPLFITLAPVGAVERIGSSLMAFAVIAGGGLLVLTGYSHRVASSTSLGLERGIVQALLHPAWHIGAYLAFCLAVGFFLMREDKSGLLATNAKFGQVAVFSGRVELMPSQISLYPKDIGRIDVFILAKPSIATKVGNQMVTAYVSFIFGGERLTFQLAQSKDTDEVSERFERAILDCGFIKYDAVAKADYLGSVVAVSVNRFCAT